MKRIAPLLCSLLLCACTQVRIGDDDTPIIRVTSPTPGQTVGAEFPVTGEARGMWFFEATAPMELVDEHGKVIGQAFITATEPWMTEDFIPFRGQMQAVLGDAKEGVLIMKKSNPSGLPEHDLQIEIPLIFTR